MVKVAVLGAGGGVGQALCLQLRLSPLVDELALYDRTKAPGVAVDLSHIPSKQVVKGYKAIDDGLTKTLSGADIVLVTAGPSVRKDAIIKSRNDLLQFNAPIVGSLLEACCMTCPKALLMIVTNPINAIVPFAAEVLKKQGMFDARRLLGVTTLDVVRAETFLKEMLDRRTELGTGPVVDVIGGHSAETIIPLFSQVKEAKTLSTAQVDNLIYHTLYGGAEVYLAKEKKSGATLSTACAVFRITERACRALKGEQGLRECAFVYLPGIDGGKEVAEAVGVNFFSVPVELSVDGAAKVVDPLQILNDKEREMTKKAVKQLLEDEKLGSEFGDRWSRTTEPNL
ncbi:malate dehydrogenase, NAD-dependent [Usnea florida]